MATAMAPAPGARQRGASSEPYTLSKAGAAWPGACADADESVGEPNLALIETGLNIHDIDIIGSGYFEQQV